RRGRSAGRHPGALERPRRQAPHVRQSARRASTQNGSLHGARSDARRGVAQSRGRARATLLVAPGDRRPELKAAKPMTLPYAAMTRIWACRVKFMSAFVTYSTEKGSY